MLELNVQLPNENFEFTQLTAYTNMTGKSLTEVALYVTLLDPVVSISTVL